MALMQRVEWTGGQVRNPDKNTAARWAECRLSASAGSIKMNHLRAKRIPNCSSLADTSSLVGACQSDLPGAFRTVFVWLLGSLIAGCCGPRTQTSDPVPLPEAHAHN